MRIECTFSVDDRGDDVLARIALVPGGPCWDIIRPISLTADSEEDLYAIVYEVEEDKSNENE
jgi:hypothetical protein